MDYQQLPTSADLAEASLRAAYAQLGAPTGKLVLHVSPQEFEREIGWHAEVSGVSIPGVICEVRMQPELKPYEWFLEDEATGQRVGSRSTS